MDSLAPPEQLTRRLSFETGTARIKTKARGLATAEGQSIEVGAWAGNAIGVFTSGGDSQGMNAAVRAIFRLGTYLGCKVFYIKEGYQGMVDGGKNIEEGTWSSTGNMIHIGGTVIGSARCMDFKERWGRLKAAQNLIHHGITNLIAIGGDGSLTGANCFRQEWPSLIRELVDKEVLPKHSLDRFGYLNIVGLVGSIDNDFCGTDMTIGVDTALHRIQEAVDGIMTTAVSHKRAFVLEIMGRMCGYLPLVAGITSEASAIFIPEDPPPGDWKQNLCDQLQEKVRAGEVRRTHIVLVAEGAMDREGNPIKCYDVQKVLAERMKMDVRVTVLGHVQRGGNTSAFDRLLGTRMGAEAVLALMESDVHTPACVITLDGNDVVRTPLMKAVETTRQVGVYMAEKDFDEVVNLRGRTIFQNLVMYLMLHKVITHPVLLKENKKVYRIGMIHVGHPACGMNACARGFVGVCVTKGYRPVFIYDSWDGLLRDRVQTVTWNDVNYWTAEGGSLLGTFWKTAEDCDIRVVASKLREHQISGLVIVGGFEAFQSAYELSKARSTYPELCIPINVVPATIANNVPGCDFCVGVDTALNQICKACDDLKQSAFSIQKIINVVEVGGDNCGCLATLAAIASGADHSFIKEEPFTVRDIQSICQRLKNKLLHSGLQYGIVIRNENANQNLTTDFMYRIFNEEGKPFLGARATTLGPMQEGQKASPYDRNSGIKAGSKSAAWLILTMESCGAKDFRPIFTDSPSTVTLTASKKGSVSYPSIEELAKETDFENRLPINQWWMKLRNLIAIMTWPTEDAFKIFNQYQEVNFQMSQN